LPATINHPQRAADIRRIAWARFILAGEGCAN
jgi:hypothetical protein